MLFFERPSGQACSKCTTHCFCVIAKWQAMTTTHTQTFIFYLFHTWTINTNASRTLTLLLFLHDIVWFTIQSEWTSKHNLCITMENDQLRASLSGMTCSNNPSGPHYRVSSCSVTHINTNTSLYAKTTHHEALCVCLHDYMNGAAMLYNFALNINFEGVKHTSSTYSTWPPSPKTQHRNTNQTKHFAISASNTRSFNPPTLPLFIF